MNQVLGARQNDAKQMVDSSSICNLKIEADLAATLLCRYDCRTATVECFSANVPEKDWIGDHSI